MSEFYSKIAGVTAKNDDGSSRQKIIKNYVKTGTPLILLREPSNKFDPNAISVHIKKRSLIFFTSTVQIGYLNKDVAEELTKFLKKGGAIEAIAKEVTGGKGVESYGVNIFIRKKTN